MCLCQCEVDACTTVRTGELYLSGLRVSHRRSTMLRSYAISLYVCGWLRCRSLRFLYVCVSAAVSLHNQLLAHLLRLPKTFFDTNPAGKHVQHSFRCSADQLQPSASL